jgi:sugar lactone lactonase YvrE
MSTRTRVPEAQEGTPRRHRGLWPAVLLAWALAPGWARAGGGTLVYSSLVQPVATGATVLAGPAGVAADGYGTVYIADTGNNRVVRVDRDGSASVLAITGLGTPLDGPRGLALDGAGDLFIADSGNARVVKVDPAGAGSEVNTGAVTLAVPAGVAVDAAGDLFIVDSGADALVEVPASGAASTINITGLPLAASLSSPQGVAIDAGGNLFIADTGHGRVVEVAGAAAGGTAGTVVDTGVLVLDAVAAVAVDGTGNLYIADTPNDRIVKVDGAGNATVRITDAAVPGPVAIAATPLGQLYVATGNQADQVMPGTVDCGRTALATGAPTTRTLTFTAYGGLTVDSIGATTQGGAGLDFTVTGGTLQAGGTGGGTVVVTFQPTAAGLRQGALVIRYSGNPNPAVTVPLYGFADAPAPVLNPGVASVVDTGSGSPLSFPFQSAWDGSGNLYVSSYQASAVYRIPPGGSLTPVVFGTFTPNQVCGVAVDGAGNVYCADYQGSRVLALSPGGNAVQLDFAGQPAPVLDHPTSLGFDPAGNLLIANYGEGTLVRVDSAVLQAAITGTAANGTTAPIPATLLPTGTFAMGTNTLVAASADPYGNVYCADYQGSRILRVRPDGSASVLDTSAAGALSSPYGVVADPFGNVYVLDSGHARVVQVATTGAAATATALAFTGGTLHSQAFGITASPDGSLVLADSTGGQLLKVALDRSTLAFPATNVGATSAARTTTVRNCGTQDLVFSADPTYSAAFVRNDADPDLAASGTILAPGDTADVSAQFVPQAPGSQSDDITLTDNAFNVPGRTQTVTASGTGVLAAPATQAGALAFTGVEATRLTASWTRGNGSGVAVFAAQGSAGQPTLSGSAAYTANATFGAGSPAGAGWYCVYAGTGTSVTVEGLAATTGYRVFVAEYSSAGGSYAYNGTSASGNAANQATGVAAYTLTFVTDGTPGATLTGSASQQVAPGADAAPVTAVAPAGYLFSAWTGTGGFAGTTDNPLTVTGVAADATFTATFTAAPAVVITPPAEPTVPVTAGGNASATLTLGGVGGVAAPATLAASGLPAGVACAFSQNPVDLGSGPVDVVVTFTVPPPFRIIGWNRGGPGFGLGAGALLLGGLLAVPAARRRRRGGWLPALLALALAAGMTTCSSNQGGLGATNAAPAVAPGTYPVTITATAQGAAQAATTLQLTIQ